MMGLDLAPASPHGSQPRGRDGGVAGLRGGTTALGHVPEYNSFKISVLTHQALEP